jgi:hypothetical protein
LIEPKEERERMRFGNLLHVLRHRLRVISLNEIAKLIEIEILEHVFYGIRDLAKGLLGPNRHKIAGESFLCCRLCTHFPSPFAFLLGGINTPFPPFLL